MVGGGQGPCHGKFDYCQQWQCVARARARGPQNLTLRVRMAALRLLSACIVARGWSYILNEARTLAGNEVAL